MIAHNLSRILRPPAHLPVVRVYLPGLTHIPSFKVPGHATAAASDWDGTIKSHCPHLCSASQMDTRVDY